MMKLIVALCTVVMLACAGSVQANEHKVSICHNGSTIDDVGTESSISFVITIAGRQVARAVEKHVDNHGDAETYDEIGTGEECQFNDEAVRECKEVVLCQAAIT